MRARWPYLTLSPHLCADAVCSCKPLSDAESVRVCVSNGVLSTQSLIKVAFV